MLESDIVLYLASISLAKARLMTNPDKKQNFVARTEISLQLDFDSKIKAAVGNCTIGEINKFSLNEISKEYPELFINFLRTHNHLFSEFISNFLSSDMNNKKDRQKCEQEYKWLVYIYSCLGGLILELNFMSFFNNIKKFDRYIQTINKMSGSFSVEDAISALIDIYNFGFLIPLELKNILIKHKIETKQELAYLRKWLSSPDCGKIITVV